MGRGFDSLLRHMTVFNKLVRDRITKIIEKQGKTPVTHIATPDEFYRSLKAKLLEEVEEFNKSGEIEELADLLQVIYTICDYRNISRESLEDLRRKKNEDRGKFNERVILDEVKE